MCDIKFLFSCHFLKREIWINRNHDTALSALLMDPGLAAQAQSTLT